MAQIARSLLVCVLRPRDKLNITRTATRPSTRQEATEKTSPFKRRSHDRLGRRPPPPVPRVKPNRRMEALGCPSARQKWPWPIPFNKTAPVRFVFMILRSSAVLSQRSRLVSLGGWKRDVLFFTTSFQYRFLCLFLCERMWIGDDMPLNGFISRQICHSRERGEKKKGSLKQRRGRHVLRITPPQLRNKANQKRRMIPFVRLSVTYYAKVPEFF